MRKKNKQNEHGFLVYFIFLQINKEPFLAVCVQHVCPFRTCSERYRCPWCIWCWREVQQLVSCPSSCGCRAWHYTKAVTLSGRWGICGCPSALEADGMQVVRVGLSDNCAACQAICLVQYSDVWEQFGVHFVQLARAARVLAGHTVSVPVLCHVAGQCAW